MKKDLKRYAPREREVLEGGWMGGEGEYRLFIWIKYKTIKIKDMLPES